jgi:hypothetical protein
MLLLLMLLLVGVVGISKGSSSSSDRGSSKVLGFRALMVLQVCPAPLPLKPCALWTKVKEIGLLIMQVLELL